MNREKLVLKLYSLRNSRFGIDTDNGIQVPKDKVLIEYDNDWHTLNGMIDELLEIIKD